MPWTFSRLGAISSSGISHFDKGSIKDGKVDATNTCNGRRNDGSCIDYQGADGIQDAYSVINIHDRLLPYSRN
jgi:hypothetical protein